MGEQVCVWELERALLVYMALSRSQNLVLAWKKSIQACDRLCLLVSYLHSDTGQCEPAAICRTFLGKPLWQCWAQIHVKLCLGSWENRRSLKQPSCNAPHPQPCSHMGAPALADLLTEGTRPSTCLSLRSYLTRPVTSTGQTGISSPSVYREASPPQFPVPESSTHMGPIEV